MKNSKNMYYGILATICAALVCFTIIRVAHITSLLAPQSSSPSTDTNGEGGETNAGVATTTQVPARVEHKFKKMIPLKATAWSATIEIPMKCDLYYGDSVLVNRDGFIFTLKQGDSESSKELYGECQFKPCIKGTYYEGAQSTIPNTMYILEK